MAYERNKGKSATVLGVEFGEKLVWKRKAGKKMNKINSRCEFGIFVGGEFWIATPDGIHKARSVRRIARQDRWTGDSLGWVRHVPWNRYKDHEDADGDIPDEKAVEIEVKESREGQIKNKDRLEPGGECREPRFVVKVRQPPPRAFRSGRRTRRSTATPGAVRAVRRGFADWAANHTRPDAESDSQG